MVAVFSVLHTVCGQCKITKEMVWADLGEEKLRKRMGRLAQLTLGEERLMKYNVLYERYHLHFTVRLKMV